MKPTVLIAVEQYLLRLGLQTLIEAMLDYKVAGFAFDAATAMQQTAAVQPDLLVIDMSLPGMNGVGGIAQVLRRHPNQKMVALADSRSDIDASDALRAGCLGYLLKSSTQEEAALALRTVMTGRRFISASLAEHLLANALHVGTPATGLGVWGSLSARERSVFRLIARGGTNRSAAQTLNISPKTIEKHRANLMRKLNARSAVELMLLAVELGLVDRPAVQLPARNIRPEQTMPELAIAAK